MKRAPRGFTLLELLVAIAVLAVLIVLLDQGTRFGLRATAMQSDTKERAGDLDAVDRALRQLIARADPGRFPDPATLHGTAAAVSLTTELPLPGGEEPRRVAATLAVADGQLRLRFVKLRHVDPFGAEPPAEQVVLADGVSGLQIAYFPRGGREWLPSWDGEALPALVRLQIAFAAKGRHWPPLVVATPREALEQ